MTWMKTMISVLRHRRTKRSSDLSYRRTKNASERLRNAKKELGDAKVLRLRAELITNSLKTEQLKNNYAEMVRLALFRERK